MFFSPVHREAFSLSHGATLVLTFVFFSRYAGDNHPCLTGVVLLGFVRISHFGGCAESRTSTNCPSLRIKVSLLTPVGRQFTLAT